MTALSALRSPLRVLATINEVKEVLIHIRFSIVHRYKKICLTWQIALTPCGVSSGSTLFVNAPIFA